MSKELNTELNTNMKQHTDCLINEAIAEACGWTVDKRGLGWLSPNGYYTQKPDYCTDLNAMHEAEKVHRMGSDWPEYLDYLEKVALSDVAYATARHRAEAFLRTLGKWEEALE